MDPPTIFTVLLLSAAAGCSAPADPSVVGLWESQETTMGGLGHALELKADGALVSATSVIVDLAYRTQRDELFLISPAARGGEQEGVRYRIDDGDLVQSAAPAGEIRKSRMGGAAGADASLVGDWRYRHYTGAIAFERYTANGRMLFRLPMKSESGCFRANDGLLVLETNGGAGVLRYVAEPDALTLSSDDGRSVAYNRADPWYPRETIDYVPPEGIEELLSDPDL